MWSAYLWDYSIPLPVSKLHHFSCFLEKRQNYRFPDGFCHLPFPHWAQKPCWHLLFPHVPKELCKSSCGPRRGDSLETLFGVKTPSKAFLSVWSVAKVCPSEKAFLLNFCFCHIDLTLFQMKQSQLLLRVCVSPRAGEVLTSSKGSAADFRTPTPTFQHFLSFILFLDIRNKTKSPGLHGIHEQWPPWRGPDQEVGTKSPVLMLVKYEGAERG